jgi:hypothetical protein
LILLSDVKPSKGREHRVIPEFNRLSKTMLVDRQAAQEHPAEKFYLLCSGSARPRYIEIKRPTHSRRCGVSLYATDVPAGLGK